MIDLPALERSVFGRQPDRWRQALAQIQQLAGPAFADLSPAEALSAKARLAAVIGAVLADPTVELPAEEILSALPFRQGLANLAAASAFGSFDHLLRAMGLPDAGGAPTTDPVSPAVLAKAVLLLTLDSAVDFTPEDLLALPPALAQMAFISHVASKPVATVRGMDRRNALLARAGALQPAPLPATVNHLVALSSAWMICSYADHPRKHSLKPVLNRTLRDLAERIGLAEPSLPVSRVLKDRPRMVVAAEIMHSNHVQFRYFGQYLRQLRSRFELVLVTEDREADPAARALFDEVFTFQRSQNGEHLGAIARRLAELRPDIVFWPSVGMRHWGPLLANLRFAPIQMTALGHSASTFCPTIDYYLTEEGYVSDPALFSERLLLMPDAALRFERSPHYQPVRPEIRERARPLRIALPSNTLKLNPRFLTLLARIREAAGRDLEFHLFPNSDGPELEALSRMVTAILPGARVHGRMAYNAYLPRLSACDLNLSPFPFGGLHSVVDSLRQGIPVVAMECPEPHGRTDAMLLRRLGMPDWLVAKDEAEYVAAALRVIGDDATRVALSRQALALDLDNTLFGDAGAPLRSEVIDAVWWAYRNHDEVLAGDRRVIRPADWSDSAATERLDGARRA
ncbi:hypothetical protein DJ021_09210 [Phenylobacterium hankyongense]|uniref:Uncharacterized protein n=1 Tax=Phenylobacterium hankyongense TaxID=1813876 RepID=A0A328AZ88_9CAUL|nr:hypothetical protein [Phenylobacterium hankyongense]RAK59969.1 hypothetical protein DJ021_09210 [Phenylobacterium hankyongense]